MISERQEKGVLMVLESRLKVYPAVSVETSWFYFQICISQMKDTCGLCNEYVMKRYIWHKQRYKMEDAGESIHAKVLKAVQALE